MTKDRSKASSLAEDKMFNGNLENSSAMGDRSSLVNQGRASYSPRTASFLANDSQQGVKTTKVLEKYNKHHTVLLKPDKQSLLRVGDNWTVLETKKKKLVLEVNPQDIKKDPTVTYQQTHAAKEEQTQVPIEEQTHEAKEEQTVDHQNIDWNQGKVLESKQKELVLEFPGHDTPQDVGDQEPDNWTVEDGNVKGLEEFDNQSMKNQHTENTQRLPSLCEENQNEVVLEKKTKRFTCVVYPSQGPNIDAIDESLIEDQGVEETPEETVVEEAVVEEMDSEVHKVDSDLQNIEELVKNQEWEILETKTKVLTLEVPAGTGQTNLEEESGGDTPITACVETGKQACCGNCKTIDCPSCNYDLSNKWSRMQLFALEHWLLLASIFFSLGLLLPTMAFYNIDIVLYDDSYIPWLDIYKDDDPAIVGVFHNIWEKVLSFFAFIRNGFSSS